MNVKIKSIEYSLPKKREKLKDLIKYNPNWNYDRILKASGINNRFISSESENIISLSVKSSKKILKKFPKDKIDFLIFVTQTSHLKLPSIACVLQNKLKLRNNILAFDINMGCSGFVYALNIAQKIILSKECKNGLIICSDTYSKYIKKNNSSCRPIFSDASSSILVGNTNEKSILNFVYGTDGSGAYDLYLEENSNNIYMNGSKVALFSLNRVPKSIKELLVKTNIKINKIDKFVFHQASKFVLDHIYKSLKIKKNQIYENYNKFGNTVSSSIPIALKEASKFNLIKNNDNIILSGFGVGLSWASVLIKWKKIN